MRRHLVDTDEGTLHFRSAGELEGDRTVLFFHQSPSSSRMWADVMEDLARHGIGSLAGDMFDYGMSDPQTSQLDVGSHARLIVDAARTLTSGRFVLVGHHTGAVFAAAATDQDTAGLVVIGFPLYTSWREKYERLGARIGPDRFSDDGADLAQLWVRLNESLEADTEAAHRQMILVDRLAAGPVWYTAYAALLQSDLTHLLRQAIGSGVPIKTVFARQDAISRFEPAVTELTGVQPSWIEGGPWVTIEHPDRVASSIRSFLEDGS